MNLYHFGDKEYNHIKKVIEEGVITDSENTEDEVVEEGITSAIKDVKTIASNVKNMGLSISGIKKLWSDDKNYKILMTAMPEVFTDLSDATKLALVKDIFKNDKIKSIKKFIGSSGEAFVPGGSDKDKAIAFFDMLFASYFNPQFAKNGISEFKKQMGTKFNEIAQATKTESSAAAKFGQSDQKLLDKKVSDLLEKKSNAIIDSATEFFKSGDTLDKVEKRIFTKLLKTLGNEPFSEDGSISVLDQINTMVSNTSNIDTPEEALIVLVGDEIDELMIRAKNKAA